MSSRDLHEYARQTSIRLVIGGILLLFLVGDGLIYLIYGPGAALTGLICLAAALGPVVLILVILGVMEWVVKHARQE